MIQDKLYELAFQYKEAKLWKKLYDTQIFAFRLSDGQIGYLSVMGKHGEHCALALYIGDEAFQSYRNLLRGEIPGLIGRMELIYSQKCMQCELTTKEYLSDEEYKGIKAYTKKHQIRLAGKNAYPQFMKYDPEYIPWPVESEIEQSYLMEALSAALEMNRLLEESVPPPNEFGPDLAFLPFLEPQDGAFVCGHISVPPEREPEYPRPILDELSAARLKRYKKVGVWECKVSRFPNPIQDSPDEIPALPMLILAIDLESGRLAISDPILRYNENAAELLKSFVGNFVVQKKLPKEIRVFDRRSECFFADLCDKANILLRLCEESEFLEDAEIEFVEQMRQSRYEEEEDDEAFVEEMVDAVLKMDRAELQEIPPVIIRQLKLMADSGVLPPGKARALKERLP